MPNEFEGLTPAPLPTPQYERGDLVKCIDVDTYTGKAIVVTSNENGTPRIVQRLTGGWGINSRLPIDSIPRSYTPHPAYDGLWRTNTDSHRKFALITKAFYPGIAQTPRCYECREEINENQILLHEGEEYCEPCYDNVARFECSGCGRMTENAYRYETNGQDLCYGCNERVQIACGLDECEACEEGMSVPERPYNTRNLGKFQGKLKGDIITSQRMFSAEIECYYPTKKAMHQAADEIPEEFGVDEDGSLNSRGVEFQTPKLKGGKGEQAIKQISKVLTAHEFTTDSSAGLHIHLDGKGLMPTTRTKDNAYALRTCMAFYLAFEEVIMSFLPRSRRGNRYCESLNRQYHLDEVLQTNTVLDIEKLWYREVSLSRIAYNKTEKYHNSRYRGVNFHSLLKDGHLEIRYHSATMNAKKILEWTALHQAIMDMSVTDSELLQEGARKALGIDSLKGKTALFMQVLNMPPRARKYFMSRQKAFNSTEGPRAEESAVSETLLCVE